MKLHEATKSSRGRTYCGPAALSIITGKSVEDCKAVLRTVSGKRAIRGVSASNMLAAFHRMGYMLDEGSIHWHRDCRPTLAAWLRGERDSAAVYLVQLTGHYVVVRGRKFADNHQPTPVFIRQAWCRRKRVVSVWPVKEVEA